MSETVDIVEIRRVTKDLVGEPPHESPTTWATLINEVAVRVDSPAIAVRSELRDMERRGELYRVGDGDTAEVRRP